MKMKILIAVMLTLLVPEWMLANVLWSSTGSTPPRHRNITLENGAPCGVGDPVTPTLLTSGSIVELEWEEIIPQDSSFEIYFSPANDSDWVLLKKVVNKVKPQDSNKTFIIHKEEVPMPDVSCEQCTLQIIQIVPGTVEAKYYSCADIKLSGSEKQEIPKDNCQ